jgi:hypothetical protein
LGVLISDSLKNVPRRIGVKQYPGLTTVDTTSVAP